MTQWICSSRCWQEGGPHDDSCHVREDLDLLRRKAQALDDLIHDCKEAGHNQLQESGNEMVALIYKRLHDLDE